MEPEYNLQELKAMTTLQRQKYFEQSQTEIDEINECLTKARKKLLQKIMYDQMLEDVEKGDYTMVNNRFAKPYLDKYREKRLDKPLHVFITINLRDDEDLEKFIKKVKKSSTKKWIKWSIYCFEQRSSTEEFSGYHCHMLINRNTKVPSELERELKSSFRKILDVENRACLNFKYIPEEAIQQKIEYMEGKKSGVDKLLKAKMDVIFRKNNNLENIYHTQDSPYL